MQGEQLYLTLGSYVGRSLATAGSCAPLSRGELDIRIAISHCWAPLTAKVSLCDEETQATSCLSKDYTFCERCRRESCQAWLRGRGSCLKKRQLSVEGLGPMDFV